MSEATVAEKRTDGRPMLEITGLKKRFGGILAIDGAEFAVPQGSITALIGPNGAGKTTLFNVVTGFYRPEAGAIRYRGESIYGKRPHDIARNGMVRTFQITKALAAMPVIDNMLLAGPNQPGERLLGLVTQPRAARRRERELEERAYELLKTFNLDEKAGQYAGTLSGGQRKLLELARALMTEPRMVLLDEPMAGINPTLGRRLLEHMEQLRGEKGVTFLFVEHDMDVVMNHSDEVVVMAEGRVIAHGPPEEIRSDERVIDAYLGGGAGGRPRGARDRRGAATARRGREAGAARPRPRGGLYPEVDILNDVDIEVRDGEIVTIVGPNGAGKSTLMKAIFGLIRPRAGEIELHGESITGERPHNVTRRGVSYVPQLDNVFPNLTVRENLELGAIAGSRARHGRAHGAHVRVVPAARGAPAPAGGHDVRRRAADGRDGARR